MISLTSIGQNTMYYMETLPQNIFYNPALIPDARFSICLPGIGGVSIKGYNSGFNYGEFDHFIDNLGREGYDPDEFINSIGDYNEFISESRVNLFTIGFRLKDRGYLSFFSHIHNFITFNAESDIAYLLADLDDLAEDKFPLAADDIDLMTNTYMTWGFTYSRKIKNLTVGISPKLNSNLVGVKSDNISYNIEIDPESGSERDYDETYNGEAIVGLPFEINPAAIVGGVLDTDEDIFPDDWGDELKISDFFNSTSLSVDLGATYTLNKWFFSASLLNLGASKWKTYGYRFYGDEETMNVNEHEKIKLKLPAKIYLGAKYQFSPKWNCGFLFHNTSFNTGSNSSATVSLNGIIGRMMSTSLSYTAGNTYDNLGLGLRLRFLPGTDLFVVTDNLIQAVNYKDANFFSVGMGINFSFGVYNDKSPL
jgi:hypothetical protein